MAAPLGREPYGKAEARTQAAEVYDDSTGTPSRSIYLVPPGAVAVAGARIPPATRSRNPGLKDMLHVKR